MRRPPRISNPTPRCLGQQPLHHASVEHRRREPAIGGSHLERPVEPLRLRIGPAQPDGVLQRRTRPGGHDDEIGPPGPRFVDDADEALLVVAGRVRARHVPIVGHHDLASPPSTPCGVLQLAGRRRAAEDRETRCEQAERVAGSGMEAGIPRLALERLAPGKDPEAVRRPGDRPGEHGEPYEFAQQVVRPRVARGEHEHQGGSPGDGDDRRDPDRGRAPHGSVPETGVVTGSSAPTGSGDQWPCSHRSSWRPLAGLAG